jgi:hypothetical protein
VLSKLSAEQKTVKLLWVAYLSFTEQKTVKLLWVAYLSFKILADIRKAMPRRVNEYCFR